MEVFLNVCTIQAPRFYHGDIRQEGGRGSVEGCSLCNEQTFLWESVGLPQCTIDFQFSHDAGS